MDWEVIDNTDAGIDAVDFWSVMKWINPSSEEALIKAKVRGLSDLQFCEIVMRGVDQAIEFRWNECAGDGENCRGAGLPPIVAELL